MVRIASVTVTLPVNERACLRDLCPCSFPLVTEMSAGAAAPSTAPSATPSAEAGAAAAAPASAAAGAVPAAVPSGPPPSPMHFVIVPGNGCVPVVRCNWYRWLQQALEKVSGWTVSLQDM